MPYIPAHLEGLCHTFPSLLLWCCSQVTYLFHWEDRNPSRISRSLYPFASVPTPASTPLLPFCSCVKHLCFYLKLVVPFTQNISSFFFFCLLKDIALTILHFFSISSCCWILELRAWSSSLNSWASLVISSRTLISDYMQWLLNLYPYPITLFSIPDLSISWASQHFFWEVY